jgi:hypothetical protein
MDKQLPGSAVSFNVPINRMVESKPTDIMREKNSWNVA